MGNCLVLQKEKGKKKLIKIMMVDGKILRYRSPLKVFQALSEFPGHAISEALPVVRHLDPDDNMSGGNLYYLLPPKSAPPPAAAVDQTGRRDLAGRGSNVVRIKLVVSKQELKEMLSRGGGSLGDMLSRLQSTHSESGDGGGGGDKGRCRGWRPVLDSIPEGNDFC